MKNTLILISFFLVSVGSASAQLIQVSGLGQLFFIDSDVSLDTSVGVGTPVLVQAEFTRSGLTEVSRLETSTLSSAAYAGAYLSFFAGNYRMVSSPATMTIEVQSSGTKIEFNSESTQSSLGGSIVSGTEAIELNSDPLFDWTDSMWGLHTTSFNSPLFYSRLEHSLFGDSNFFNALGFTTSTVPSLLYSRRGVDGLEGFSMLGDIFQLSASSYAIPEPSHYGLAGALTLALIIFSRRRKQN